MPAIRLLWAWRANCITKGTMRPSGESELQEQYRRLPDDELLAIAASGEGFTETARRATADELKRRGLAGDAVWRLWRTPPESYGPIPNRVNGCGTRLLNKRDHRPDGSYVVTKWLSIFWIPVIPLPCLRVRRIPDGFQNPRCVARHWAADVRIQARGDGRPMSNTGI